MRELGRVIRTVFLLEYLSDPELRRLIHGATNKCERFNKFTKWLSFGGNQTILENDRDKQRKIIKFNHLVANCLIFHNVQSMSRILNDLALEGRGFNDEVLSRLGPYLTGHVNRFGKYPLNMNRTTVPLNLNHSAKPEPVTA